ncbi:MAG: hypothetical protein ACPGGJ_04730, partial [Coraliomargarita sp.]
MSMDVAGEGSEPQDPQMMTPKFTDKGKSSLSRNRDRSQRKGVVKDPATARASCQGLEARKHRTLNVEGPGFPVAVQVLARKSHRFGEKVL